MQYTRAKDNSPTGAFIIERAKLRSMTSQKKNNPSDTQHENGPAEKEELMPGYCSSHSSLEATHEVTKVD